VNATTSNSYFHGHKGNFKETFCHQKWNNSVKKGKERKWKQWQIIWKYKLSLW